MVVAVLVGVADSEFGSKLMPVALAVFVTVGTAAAFGDTTIVSISLAPAARLPIRTLGFEGESGVTPVVEELDETKVKRFALSTSGSANVTPVSSLGPVLVMVAV